MIYYISLRYFGLLELRAWFCHRLLLDGNIVICIVIAKTEEDDQFPIETLWRTKPITGPGLITI